jgi:RNA polymerase sigma factor (sigma-70 family)
MRRHPKGGYKGLREERNAAASAIHGGITDYLRQHGPLTRWGDIRYIKAKGSAGAEFDPLEHARAADVASEAELDGLDELGLNDREILVLKGLVEGLTQPEIGQKLGITGSGVSQMISKIRERYPELKERLEAAI